MLTIEQGKLTEINKANTRCLCFQEEFGGYTIILVVKHTHRDQVCGKKLKNGVFWRSGGQGVEDREWVRVKYRGEG